jgi:hypothetical protein
MSQVGDGVNRVVTTYDTEHLTPQASIWLVQAIKDTLLKK